MVDKKISEAARREMRKSLVAGGIEPARAVVIVDLAALAAERAVAGLFQIAERAGDSGAELSVIEISSQLTSHMMDQLFRATHGFAVAHGTPHSSAEISL